MIRLSAVALIALILSFDASPPGTAIAALITLQGRPQSFPGDAGIGVTRSGCCSHHGGVCGCDGGTGHKLGCDGQDSPSCGC